jgi:hypothetical protein
MLTQPRRDPSPLALLQLEIPDRTQPILDSGEWGINIAAARGLAPDKGLKVYFAPWANMRHGDKIELLLNRNVVDQDTIDINEVGQRTTLYVAPGRLLTGSYDLQYRVTRLNQAPELSTPPVKIYVKLERPAGTDENGSVPGHSELYLYIDPQIIQDGVDKDIAEAGIDIVVKAKPGNPSKPLYPNIAVGDRCKSSWGGWYVFSERVTQQHIDDPEGHPLKIHVDKDTIYNAGDTDTVGLAVAFEVHDIVDNRSEDWSAEIRIQVDTGNTRLGAPIVKEAINNVLNLDTLGDAPVTLQIFATDADFKLGDVIIGIIRGTTLEGDPIAIEVRGEPLTNLPSVVELKLPNAAARLLAKTQAVFSYRVERSGSPDLPAKGRFVHITGEARRLLAPIAEDAEQGALDPELDFTVMMIPFDEVMEAGMAIVPRWVGAKPDFTTYDPELDWHILSDNDIAAKEPIPIIVAGSHLKAIEGGTLDLFYMLLAEVGDSILRRESIHHVLLRVGEPQLELVAPIVLGEQDGALEPGDLPNGISRLTAPRASNPTKRGDKVTYTWEGSVTGKTSDSIDISLNADKDIVFALNEEFVKAHIEPNRNGTVRASYEILRSATETTPEWVSYSNSLVFSVGAALELDPPTIQQAEPDGTTLQPIKAVDALTAIIASTGLLLTDLLSVTWTGATGTAAGGSHTTVARPISEIGLSIALPVTVLAFSLNQSVTVTFAITRGGRSTTSKLLPLNIGTLPASELNSPRIEEADDNDVLDVTALGGKNVTIRLLNWLLIAVGQQVWMSLEGKKADGSAHDLTVWAGGGSYVNDTWFSQGFWVRSVANSYFAALGDGSKLTIKFKVALDQSDREGNALVFADQVYTIRAFEVVKPTITLAEDSKGVEIPEAGFTVDTTVKLTGVASKGQKVQIKDGTTVKGEATASTTNGEWTLTLTGLSVAAHSFTATALYGTGVVSAARTLTVTAVVAPTITSVKDFYNNEVPNGSTITHTDVTLKGKASAHQEVEIFNKGVTTGQKPKADASGNWTIVLGFGVASHSVTAKARYGNGAESVARTFTVANAVVPVITSIRDSKREIPNGGTTVDTTLTLTGTATPNLEIEVYCNGVTTNGKATANASGIWTRVVSLIPVGTNNFTAKALYGSGTVSEAWVVNVTAVVAPTITKAADSKNVEIPQAGTTADTAVTLTGTASKGQKVQIFDGTTSKGEASAHLTSGIWTHAMTGLSVAAHSFTAKALYGSGQVSTPARTLTVTAVVAPTITKAADSKNVEIPQAGITADTAVTLTGTASKGQKVQIFDGTTSKGEASAHLTSGIWTHAMTGLSVAAHSFTATALYGTGVVSAARTLTVTAVVAPTITKAEDSKKVLIPQAGFTLDTAVTLTGVASKGQKVQIKDGTTVKGEATANTTNGEWTLTLTGLGVAAHSFTAKALYGSGQVSTPARTLTVVRELVISPTPMVISGWHLFLAPAPYTPTKWQAKGYVPPAATQTRAATGGLQPYTYTSANPNIAKVDPVSGQVISQRNGSTTITVTDATRQTKTYQVTCTNVIEIVATPVLQTYLQVPTSLQSIPGAAHFPAGWRWDPTQPNPDHPIYTQIPLAFTVSGSDTYPYGYWCTTDIVRYPGSNEIYVPLCSSSIVIFFSWNMAGTPSGEHLPHALIGYRART